MNHLEFSKIKPSFLQRRYAIRLGRRYVSAAAGVLLLGLIGCSRMNQTNVIAQSLYEQQQSQTTDTTDS